MSEDSMDAQELAAARAAYDTNQDGVLTREEVAASSLERAEVNTPGLPNLIGAAASQVPILGPLINNMVMGDLVESRDVYEAKVGELYSSLGVTDGAVSTATGEPVQ